MYIYIYYPFHKKPYFTVAIDSNFNIYWQASQISRMFNLSKNVKSLLYKYLSRNERFKRFKDITNAGNSNNYALTTDQVLKLIHNIRPYRQHQNAQFETWFHSVIEGRQLLYPKNVRDYILLTKNPFQRKGFPAECIDVNRDGSFNDATTVVSDPEETLADHTYSSPVPEGEEDSVDIDEPEAENSTAYLNPPSCSSIYSEINHSPPYSNPHKNMCQDYLFTLPLYIRHLKSTFGPQNVSSMFPRMHYVPTNHEENDSAESIIRASPSPPAAASENQESGQSSTSSPEQQTSSAEQAEPTTMKSSGENERKERNLFPMDVDEKKSFIYIDPMFKTEYKFHALKVNWISGLRSIAISPFFLNDESDGQYLFFPVKKQ